jgi:hypothetical protein
MIVPLGSKGTPRPARLRSVLLRRRKGARPPALRGLEIRATAGSAPAPLQVLPTRIISESLARDAPRAARPRPRSRSRLPRRCAARARRLAAAPPARAASSPRARARAPRRQLPPRRRAAVAVGAREQRHAAPLPSRDQRRLQARAGRNIPKPLVLLDTTPSRTPLQPALARTRHARRHYLRRQRATEPLCQLARRWSGELTAAGAHATCAHATLPARESFWRCGDGQHAVRYRPRRRAARARVQPAHGTRVALRPRRLRGTPHRCRPAPSSFSPPAFVGATQLQLAAAGEKAPISTSTPPFDTKPGAL